MSASHTANAQASNAPETGGVTVDKIYFSVLDSTDGRRYKVFLRPDDIPKLKISKIRKTLSAIAEKPPFSFDLWLDNTPLRNREDANCAALGITPQSVLVMRPCNDMHHTHMQEVKVVKENVGCKETHQIHQQPHREEEEHHVAPDALLTHRRRSSSGRRSEGATGARTTTRQTPQNRSPPLVEKDEAEESVPNVTERTTAPSLTNSPVTFGLSERQRRLQAELYEEAKRSQLFPASSRERTATEAEDMEPPDATVEDSFIDEIIGAHLAPSASPPSAQPEPFAPPLSALREASQTSGSNEPKHPISQSFGLSLETLLQGADYYDMYCADGNGNVGGGIAERKGEPDSPIASNTPGMLATRETERKETHAVYHSSGQPTPVPAMRGPSLHMCHASALAELVETLQDDVNDLLALHVRSESARTALQEALAASQAKANQLARESWQAKQQLETLFTLHAEQSGIDAEVLKSAVTNLTAMAECARLRSETDALTERLNRETRRRRETLMLLEDLKGHIRVIARVRPPLRLLCARRGSHIPSMMASPSYLGGEDINGKHVTYRNHPTHLEIPDDEEEAAILSRSDETRTVADTSRHSIVLTDADGGVKQFSFYRVFSESSSQMDVFAEIAPLVQLVCDGVNVSILAYGQTGSGKTYTIFGPEDRFTSTKGDVADDDENDDSHGNSDDKKRNHSKRKEPHVLGDTLYDESGNPRVDAMDRQSDGKGTDDDDDDDNNDEEEWEDDSVEHEDDGIVPRALRELFHRLSLDASGAPTSLQDSFFEVSCSLVELYNDRVRDLLAPSQLIVHPFHVGGAANTPTPLAAPQCELRLGKDGRTHVVGLTQHVVRDTRAALRLFRRGAARRQVHATQQNPHSSRSHALFTLHLAQQRRIAGGMRRVESKLVLCDLAGSERVGKSQSVGERLREAQCINRSLSALGDVVATLAAATASATTPAHVPYRNNKLTALLQDVIGGRSKTVLIACLGPSDPPHENHTAETLTTLQFASRVRNVRNVTQSVQSMAQSSATMASGFSANAGTVSSTDAHTEPPQAPPPITTTITTTAATSEAMLAVRRGAEPKWMRPTASSRHRNNAAPPTEIREEVCGLLPSPSAPQATTITTATTMTQQQQQQQVQQQKVVGNADVRPRMRF